MNIETNNINYILDDLLVFYTKKLELMNNPSLYINLIANWIMLFK